MSKSTRIAMLAAGALVLAGCDIVITPDRVVEGGGETITVTPDPEDSGFRCVDESTVSVYLDAGDDTDPSLLGTTTSDEGDFTFEFPAPTDGGAYEVFIECDRPTPPTSTPGEVDLRQGPPVPLIVEPEFAPEVTPAGYVVGAAPDALTVDGSWCINVVDVEIDDEEDEVILPLVTAALGDTDQAIEAGTAQPFGETWELSFDAPTEAGTYDIEVTCDYLDFLSSPSEPPTLETKSASLVVEVLGEMVSSTESLDEGDTLTVSNAESSPCVGGVVTVTVTEGETEVASVTPDVGDDGSWSAEFADLEPGDFTIAAECARETGTGPFGYEVLSTGVVATPSPTPAAPAPAPTPTPPAAAPAETARAVVAAPRFTG